MKVLFGYAANFETITAVCWQADDGSVMERVLRRDGVTVNYKHPHEDLPEMWRELGGSMNPMYPAEVEDLRTAFKYLGKSSDLVELLPRADLGPEPGSNEGDEPNDQVEPEEGN